MTLDLQTLEVGPWPENCYLLRCPATGQVAIVDPGADAETILAAVRPEQVCCFLLTHAHPDHVGALRELRPVVQAPVGVHPADAERFGIEADFPLLSGMQVEVGRQRLTVFHTPGHTPGSVCLKFDHVALVGDAIFPGGPGQTSSPEALAQSLISLGSTVFTWPDATELHPGHGGPTTVGAERPAFERFLTVDHAPGLCGEVTWG
jgi:hydroxyacylglutathione hydrolase